MYLKQVIFDELKISKIYYNETKEEIQDTDVWKATNKIIELDVDFHAIKDKFLFKDLSDDRRAFLTVFFIKVEFLNLKFNHFDQFKILKLFAEKLELIDL